MNASQSSELVSTAGRLAETQWCAQQLVAAARLFLETTLQHRAIAAAPSHAAKAQVGLIVVLSFSLQVSQVLHSCCCFHIHFVLEFAAGSGGSVHLCSGKRHSQPGGLGAGRCPLGAAAPVYCWSWCGCGCCHSASCTRAGAGRRAACERDGAGNGVHLRPASCRRSAQGRVCRSP